MLENMKINETVKRTKPLKTHKNTKVKGQETRVIGYPEIYKYMYYMKISHSSTKDKKIGGL